MTTLSERSISGQPVQYRPEMGRAGHAGWRFLRGHLAHVTCVRNEARECCRVRLWAASCGFDSRGDSTFIKPCLRWPQPSSVLGSWTGRVTRSKCNDSDDEPQNGVVTIQNARTMGPWRHGIWHLGAGHSGLPGDNSNLAADGLFFARFFSPDPAKHLKWSGAMEDAFLHPIPGIVLAKATTRASLYLGMNGVSLARTLGLSEPTVSRILKAEMPIEPTSKQGELALLLVRMYGSLYALVGSDDRVRRLWMERFNKSLGDVPMHVIQRADGLVATVSYLEATRALA